MATPVDAGIDATRLGEIGHINSASRQYKYFPLAVGVLGIAPWAFGVFGIALWLFGVFGSQ